MSITEGFDTVFQIEESALTWIAQRMHQAGTLGHRYYRVQASYCVDLQFGAPVLTVDTTSHPDGRPRVVASTPVLAHVRPVDDPGMLGDYAVATVFFHGMLVPPGAYPLGPNDLLSVDWSETSQSDFVFHSPTSGVEASVRDAIMAMLVDAKASASLGYLGDAGVTFLAMASTAGSSGAGRVLSIGLDFSGSAGDAAALNSFAQQDWAAALSYEFVTERIGEALGRALGGGTPPPIGASPVLIREEIVCTWPTPFGCLEQAPQRTYLDSLTVTLAPGAILLGGQVRQVTDSWHVPDIAAAWSVGVTLTVDSSGNVKPSIGKPIVQAIGPFAAIANFLSGGQVAGAVGAGITEVFGASLGSTDPGGVLGLVIEELSSAGRAVGTGITAKPASLEIRTDGIVVHGTFQDSRGAPVPVADVVAFAGKQPGELILHAGGSWAPGDRLTAFSWNFGDGQAATSTGATTRSVASHVYLPGGYSLCLTVQDSQGRSATQCIFVEPGILRLRLLVGDSVIWQVCKPPTHGTMDIPVEVTSSDTRISGVTVTASGNGWQRSATTDAAGRATLQLNPTDIEKNSALGGARPSFCLGGVDVTASLTGYQSITQRLWMIDCDSRQTAILAARKLRAAVLDKLAGYKALQDLREELGRRPEVIFPIQGGGPPPPIPPFDLKSRDPRLRDASAIGMSVDTLTALTKLLEHSDTIPVHILFGVDLQGPELAQEISQRLGRLWQMVTARGANFQQIYGNPGRPPGPDGPRAGE